MSKVRENDGRWMDWVRAATNDGDCLHLSSAQGSLHIRQDNRITPSGLDIAKAKRCLLPTSHQDWCLDGCISVPFEHSYPHLAARYRYHAASGVGQCLLWLGTHLHPGSPAHFRILHQRPHSSLDTPDDRAQAFNNLHTGLREKPPEEISQCLTAPIACARATSHAHQEIFPHLRTLTTTRLQLTSTHTIFLHAHCCGLRLRHGATTLSLRWVQPEDPLTHHGEQLLLHLLGKSAHQHNPYEDD